MSRRRLPDDEALLAEIRRVAALVPLDRPVTQRDFTERSSMVSIPTLHRRFGHWREMLARAGIGDRYAGRRVSAKSLRHVARTMSDYEIIAELQRVAVVLGTTTLTQADVLEHSPLGARVFVSRFGSFNAALAAAGLHHSRMANRWTDQDYVDNLRAVEQHLGRRPVRADMRHPPSRIHADSYRHKYGSWENGLAAAERQPEQTF